MKIKKISFLAIMEIVRICEVNTFNKTWNVQRLYEERFAWFADNFDFAVSLGLINEFNGELKVSSPALGNTSILKYTVAHKILSSHCNFAEFWEFLDIFKLCNNILEGNPSSKEKIKYAIVREFLCQINLVVIRGDSFCIINPEFIHTIQGSFFSLEQLRHLNQRNELIGRKAEDLVLDFEKKELGIFPTLSTVVNIKRVSDDNVQAGYDIESFDKIAAVQGVYKKIFVEVKAVNSIDYKFYWSRNEIDVAQKLGDQYYLYLVQDISMESSEIEEFQKIQNPYLYVLNNKEWLKEYESISFRKGTDKNG